MNPKEALSLLDQAVSQLNVNRQTHIKLVEALDVLKPLVEPKPKEE